eukprot:TRINITY_DN3613_c0_g1_i3.p1 TRINITY_DN3613_c0_g1~~TRINITY_DN3613_c0_g1_i3.p1  ORF type:complete len:104 (-),score=34.33 TRINITY_DN3613_c0_g1_i3:48-359(-)
MFLQQAFVLKFFFFLMIRRPPRSTQGVSSAASDVYKRQYQRRVHGHINVHEEREMLEEEEANPEGAPQIEDVAEPSTRKPEFIRSVAYVASVLQQRSGKNKQG